MYKADPRLILSLCIVGTIAISILKITYPPFLFSHSILIVIILITILIPKDFYTYLFSIITIVIILISLIANSKDLTHRVIIQQLITCGMAIFALLLALHIKKLHRFIEGEKTQLNALFEIANEGIILTNSQGEVLLVNPKARRLFLYDLNEITGKQINALFPKHEDETNSDYLSGYYHDPSGWKKEAQQSLDAVKKNGEKFPVEVSMSHYREYNKGFVLIFVTDVSERKESENQMLLQKAQLEKITSDVRKMNVELENKVSERTLILQEALRELEKSQIELSNALNDEKELNEIKSRFVSMASHEFRTPLSTILSSATLISKYCRPEDNSQREKHVNRIKDSVKHLTDLLQDFLNLGKLEEGKVMREVVFFHVRDFFLDIVEELEASLKKGQEIKLLTEGEAYFTTDKRLLKNVLINLLNNAIKFSEVDKQIFVKIDNRGHKLCLEIKDRGIGIAAEDMPHLFSTFYRGKNATNIHGTGLGLHIVKRYINMLEGDINLTSHLNEGTVCTIGLPNLKEQN